MTATSTNIDTRYLASLFIPAIVIQDEDLVNQNAQLEIFSTAIIKANKNITIENYYIYDNQHLPVVARKQKGNTSCWWMILLANAELHPMEIKSGKSLIIPDIDAITAVLSIQSNNSQRIPNYVII